MLDFSSGIKVLKPLDSLFCNKMQTQNAFFSFQKKKKKWEFRDGIKTNSQAKMLK
jgi:hypothetical protein